MHPIKWLFVATLTIVMQSVQAQSLEQKIKTNDEVLNTIPLQNGSFEVLDSLSDFVYQWNPIGFKRQTPPDIHVSNHNLHNVASKPYDGQHFISMVTRKNETWEGIYQQLQRPLLPNEQYFVELYLKQARDFKSDPQRKLSYNKPIVLRVWGINKAEDSNKNLFQTGDKVELLYKTSKIDYHDWKKHRIEIRPKKEINAILFEAFYKVPTIIPYNGHLLIDHISDIFELKKNSK